MYFRIMKGRKNKGLIVKLVHSDSFVYFIFETSTGRKIRFTSQNSFKTVKPQSKAKEMFEYAQRSQKAMSEAEQFGQKVVL